MTVSSVRIVAFLAVLTGIIIIVYLITAWQGGESEASNTQPKYHTNQVKIAPGDPSDPTECSSERFKTRVRVGSPISKPAPDNK